MWKKLFLTLAIFVAFAFAFKKLFLKKGLPSFNIVQCEELDFKKKRICYVEFKNGQDTCSFYAKAKYRGGYSSKFPKRSFTLSFRKHMGIGDFPINDDIILNASYIDKTFMRHKICYELFCEMNEERNIAPKCAYVNVLIDSVYNGLYIAMEKLDTGTLHLNRTDTMAMIFKDPPVFQQNRIIPQDTLNYFQQTYPDIKYTDNAWIMEEINDFLLNSTDSVFYQKVGQYFDIENIIDWHLLLWLTNNGDGLVKNFYLYKTCSNEPFRIAIWDYDHSFGRDGDNEYNMLERNVNFEKNHLIRRLNQDANYQQKMASRYKDLRENGIFSVEHFNAKIEENNKIIEKEIKRNEKLWPYDSKNYYDSNDYKQELCIMREYITLCISKLDEIFNYTPSK